MEPILAKLRIGFAARLNQLLSTYDFSLEKIGVEDIPWEDQSDIQRYIREQRQVYYWTVNENNFYQYQISLLSEELWGKEARYTAIQWDVCHLRYVFEGQNFIESYEYVDCVFHRVGRFWPFG